MATDLTWFKPLETQHEFICDDRPETVYAGGVGSGKTISGGFKTLRAVLKWPGTTILVGRQTYRALEDTTKRVLMDGDDKPPIIPPEMVAHAINKENRYVLRNGSEILFRSLEDYNIEKLLSLNLGGFYVDECTETTERVWLALMSRLRHPIGPRNGWGTTNPNGHDWVWRNFHEDGPGSRTEGRDCRLYIQPTENNPHLPPDYMRMLRTRPKEWQRRFVDASFDTAAGAIWDMWERPVHVVPSTIVGELPVRWYRGRAMDHGRRNPTAVLWGMVDNDGFILISDEHYAEGLLPSQHAPIIRAKDEMLAPGINLGPIIAPPDCFRRDSGGHSVADEYRSSADLALTVADDNVDAGLLRVSEWMQRDPELLFPEWHEWHGTYGPDFLSPQQRELFGREVGRGSPRLFVADRCQNLITEIPDYRWADLSPSAEEKIDAPEKPRKLRDHACDALRYYLMSRPRPFSPPRRVEPDRIVRRQSLTHGLLERQF